MRPLLSISPNYATIFWQLTPKTIQVYLQAFEDSRLRHLRDMDTQAHKIGTYLATRPLIVADITNCTDKSGSSKLQRDISQSYPQKPYWVENLERTQKDKIVKKQHTPPTAQQLAEYNKFIAEHRAKKNRG